MSALNRKYLMYASQAPQLFVHPCNHGWHCECDCVLHKWSINIMVIVINRENTRMHLCSPVFHPAVKVGGSVNPEGLLLQLKLNNGPYNEYSECLCMLKFGNMHRCTRLAP